jgi:hypothetical protein
MTPTAFIAKWRGSTLKERSFYQEHFLDLCRLVDHPTPAEADKTGATFVFEKGAAKRKGGSGWADVWKKDTFAFEYKGKHQDLDAAFLQLEQYRESLENPPLLVAADASLLKIKTNFNKAVTRIFEIPLEALAQPEPLETLRRLFHDPEKLRPDKTTDDVTREVANLVGNVADKLRSRGYSDSTVARFLDRVVFCMFAEDVDLLPEHVFTRLLAPGTLDPEAVSRKINALFRAMADGGDFGAYTIPHFNGSLFDETPFVPLVEGEILILRDAARKNWRDIDPAIFGTLFERALDARKRAQLGAHYTSREDIETLVEPVVMAPLRREWDTLRAHVEAALSSPPLPPGEGRGEGPTDRSPPNQVSGTPTHRTACQALDAFLERLRAVTVLDPACGSGNFLYVSLQKLLDLELEVINRLADAGIADRAPGVGPWQMRGIEKDPIAFQLAQMSAWIGYLQWMRRHGFPHRDEPILRPLPGFQNKDAILECTPDGTPLDPPREPDWPEAEFIVGNPPFLGSKKMRAELGDNYVNQLTRLWHERVRPEADLCCYWFEKARSELEAARLKRVGLLATQGIRGGASRETLKRIKESGDIFFAESDRDWILDGAHVHVSMIGFDDGTETGRILDGKPVTEVHSNLAGGANITTALRLADQPVRVCPISRFKLHSDSGTPAPHPRGAACATSTGSSPA